MTDGFTGTLTPAWIVYVDGQRLDTEHEGALKRIFIDDALNSRGECRLLFAQDLSSRGVLTLFSNVKVYIGYKDNVSCVFCGDITARYFRLNKDGCTFEIRCGNAFHMLQHGMQQIVYEHKTPADILRGVIERHGLKAEVEEFGPVYEFKVQQCSTDFDFVRDLARSYGKEVYAWDNTVYVQDEMRLSSEEPVYEKGKSLISCRAEQSLIYEKEAVFIDTDMQTRETIESSSVNPEGGKHKQYILEYCIDNEDAQNLAYGYMKNVLKEYRIADIKVTGDPRLTPGMRVELKYVDSDTDGEYIAERVKHELSAAGYITYADLYKPITPTGKPHDRVHKETKKEEKKQPAEQEEKAAGEDLSKSISGLAWKKDGTVITKALVGDEVTLCADTHNIADGASATIKIVEKDADGNDDDVATLSAKVQNNKIECAWKVVYTADDDDADSKKEQEEKGYTLPEYAFTVECGGEKSAESGQLNVRGWIKIKFSKQDSELLKHCNFYIYSENIKSKEIKLKNNELSFEEIPLLNKNRTWQLGVKL